MMQMSVWVINYDGDILGYVKSKEKAIQEIKNIINTYYSEDTEVLLNDIYYDDECIDVYDSLITAFKVSEYCD